MKKYAFGLLGFFLLVCSVNSQEIHVAAGLGDLEKVARLLDKDPSLLNSMYSLGTPLLWASRYGQKEVVEYLIKKGADVDLKCWGTSALFHAAFLNHEDVVETLVLGGAEMGFFEAIECGYRGIVAQMIQKGQDINEFNGSGQHPLLRAAEFGYADMVDFFLDHGVGIDLKDKRGNSLLHSAASGGRYELVSHLVDSGADVNAETERGETPLDYARYKGHQKICEFLKNKGGKSASTIKYSTIPLLENLCWISFPGRQDCNVGLFYGTEGALLIDTGGGDETGKILSDLVEKDHGSRVKYIINTHNDWDHCGGNGFYKGKAAVITALDLEEMIERGILKSAEESLDSGYKEIFGKYYTMKFNGEKILIIPVPGTHTPTDVLIYFRRADVLFTGDFMTSGRFKKQDESSEKYEKRIKGYVDILGPYLIDVLEAVTKICSSNTKCLGGHNTTFHIRNVNEYLHIAKKMIKD